MNGNQHFKRLVEAGNPVGEVVGTDRFIVHIHGLQPVNIRALIMFDDGSKGFVQYIDEEYVTVLHLGAKPVGVGSIAVVQYPKLVAKVGKDYIGRVVSVTGDPLDGKGPIAADGVWSVFNDAPSIMAREQLNTQLETGVTIVDSLFPLVRGQRLAILGDSKSGKTTLATQIALHQSSTEVIVIYVLIAKRRSDVETLLNHLEKAGAMDTTIVVVANMFESLIITYLAPYVACSMAEYLWQKEDQDVLIIYDDLTSHAQAYREISLIGGVSPGRDSYPGDIFYAHSSLLERGGKLNRNHKTLTCLPLVLAIGGDITAYLPTNVMSMTDGQWILDKKIFRDAQRPALSTGLSVTRVGGRGHNKRQKQLAAQTLRLLGAYKEALEFSHFGSELALSARRSIEVGKHLQAIFNQASNKTYSLLAQQLMLDIAISLPENEVLDINVMKESVETMAKLIKVEKDYEKIREELRTKSQVELKK